MSSRAHGTTPGSLTVLYDAHCPACRRARRWVERHRQLVPVRFVPAGSELAQRRFPELDVGSTLVDVTVITDRGAVLRGDRAWIAVLWAVARTRRLSVELVQGRGLWRLHGLKGATEAMRRFSAGQRDPGVPLADRRSWPPPQTAAHTPASDGTCISCRT